VSGNSQYNICGHIGYYDTRGHSGRHAGRGGPRGGSTKSSRPVDFEEPGREGRQALYDLQNPSNPFKPGGGWRVT
jgi:hypothetical protein